MEFFCDAFIFYLFLLKEHLQTLQKICLFELSNLEWEEVKKSFWTLRKEATSITESANLEWEEVKKVFQDIDMDQ